MNPEFDDAELTAFALGEVDEITRVRIAQQIAADPNAARTVEEIRATAAALGDELAQEITTGLGPDRLESLIARSQELVLDASPAEIVEIGPTDDHQSKTPLYHVLTHPAFAGRETRRWLATAGIAAVLLVGLGLLSILLPGRRAVTPTISIVQTQPAEPSRQVLPFVLFPDQQTTSPRDHTASDAVAIGTGTSNDAPFTDVREHPSSSFPLAVSTASYAEVRDAIAAGHLPAPGTVRIEEMVNAFQYHYPAPTGDAAFAADIEIAACPWEPAHRVARIGLKARNGSDLAARDATANVEFDPIHVAAYRLIGYDAGHGSASPMGANISAGQMITALYEVVPVRKPTADQPMLTLTLRYELPDRMEPTSQSFAAVDHGLALPQSSPDFRFAAAVADFGLILRNAPHRGTSDLARVIALASAARGQDEDGSRAGFVDLMKRSQTLKPA